MKEEANMKTEEALDFILGLANGVNPLTGEVHGKDTILNNTEVIRGLFNCHATLMQRVRFGGGKKGTEDFKLTAEELSKFEYSESPIKISDIATKLNALRTSDNMKQLSTVKITGWLLEKGFLETEPKLGEKNKDSRIATKNGAALGISTLTQKGLYGTYKFNLYDKKAQQYIVENVGEIVEFAAA